MLQPENVGAIAKVPSATALPMIISRRVGLRLIACSFYRGEQHAGER